MEVLYNGSPTEYDVYENDNCNQILASIERNKARIGQQVGDFVIVSADYDWGLLQQVNRVRCVRCGYEKGVASLSTFVRGKGEARLCKCRHKKEKKPTPTEIYAGYVGQTVNGYRLLSYEVGRGFQTECVECGKRKIIRGYQVLSGSAKCNHQIANDYSDPKYIGMKVGSLTAVERLGRKYRFRCECGTEVVHNSTEVFRRRSVASCGDPNCEYHRAAVATNYKTRKEGVEFEFECADEMKSQGFEIEMTPSTGDYGVDFFAMVDGARVAFQCKKLRQESMVSAVQEVYAGGRYYDCCKFVVVSPSGFSYSAEIMASKLGVQLERNLLNFRLKSLEENKIETQKVTTFSGRKLMWEIDGVSKPAEEWCREYGISRYTVVYRMKRHGMDLKTALVAQRYDRRTMIEINGVVKSKQEWCDEYGISPQLYDYRIKYSGLSPIEALTKEKVQRE